MTPHASTVRHTLIALAITAAFPLQAMAQDSVPAPVADAPAAPAAQAGPGQLETVIVTAQRRAENIKDVPMSIATLKGDKLDTLTAGGADIRFLNSRT
ncbi:MAG: TonB-dependent receptor, partial [Janthinobacterium sp.]